MIEKHELDYAWYACDTQPAYFQLYFLSLFVVRLYLVISTCCIKYIEWSKLYACAFLHNQGSDFSVSLSFAGHWNKVLLVRKDLVVKHHQFDFVTWL